MYSTLIAEGDETLAASKRLRAHAAEARADANALRLRYRRHRFFYVSGGSDAIEESRIRELLRAFCARAEDMKTFVGFSRGSVCQACGNIIKPSAVEYDVVAGKAVLRLDLACYRIASEITRASQENHQKSA